MAMADAAIGGKTAVNTAFGKNLIGAFKKPKTILADVDTLKTLSSDEYRNGFAEIIKHALIADGEYFKWLEWHSEALKAFDKALLSSMIERSYQLKTSIIEADFWERGQRMLLNLGHTVAHAVEKASNFELSHGKAVAIGILAEATLANYRGLIPKADIARIQKLLTHLGIDLTLSVDYEHASWQQALAVDKKNRFGVVRCVLLKSIGQPCSNQQTFAWPVSLTELDTSLRQVLATQAV
jgi:3-dehydroquinate synthase